MHNTIEADFWAELAQIQAEPIGWIPLEQGVYLHLGDVNATEVMVVGVPQAGGGGVAGMLTRCPPINPLPLVGTPTALRPAVSRICAKGKAAATNWHCVAVCKRRSGNWYTVSLFTI